MAVIRFSKVVSNLPQQLEPDTIYLVRTGNGFDLYCTDTTGSIAYQIGNADTATKLQTARTINGTNFDGSANITTAKWGTARTITIGNTGKSFDGSADVSWSLAEIGAAAASTTVNLTGNQTITGIKTFTVSPVVPAPTADNHPATAGYVSSRIAELFNNTAKIIGLVQAATGGGTGTYVRIGENFAPKITDTAFFNNHPTYAGIVAQIIDGQEMIRIPKFYFKAGTVPSGVYAGKAYWMISDQPFSGFSVHPAFIGAGGVELDQIWVGKYQASASGGKLQSVPGVLPVVSINFQTVRQYAYARNTGGVTGFRLWSYYDLAAIQMLATIEMGGLDMQALIGQGRVNTSSATNVDAADVAQATWRGIVGLWGNAMQMVDGIKRNSGNWWRWQYNVPGNTTTSDFATGYINTGRAALTSNGYPVTFDTTLLSAGIIVPATVDGTASNGSTGDGFTSNTFTNDRIVYSGGHWGQGVLAGLFYLDVGGAPADSGPYYGCRLAKV
jgi:hypothetical protein